MVIPGSPVPTPPATRYSAQGRADRLIAFGRLGLAAFALAGVWVDPSDPEAFATTTLYLLAAYAVYAIACCIALNRGLTPSRRAAFAAHVLDLVFAVTLVMMTRGSGSPFFLFFTFVLLCASVRWGARGAAWTGAVVIVAYVCLGAVTWAWALVSDFEGNRFVIRLGLIAVMTVILMRVGAFHERLYAELQQLARWPRAPHASLDETLAADLEYAAALLHVADVLLLWHDDESSDVQTARWHDGRIEREAQPIDDAAAFPVLLPQPRSFLYDGRGARPRLIGVTEGVTEPGEVFDPGLIERHAIRTAIAVPLPRRGHEGWLLLFNGSERLLSVDDVTLAEIVTAEISGSLERWRLTARARDAALAEDRLRVARDLHDGVLQSMTGCRLGIAGIAAATEPVLPNLADQLRGVERSLAHDQQELRQFIQALRPAADAASRTDATPLRELCDRVRRQWGLDIALDPEADRAIPPALRTQVLLLVHEALVNVARHAAASSARVLVEQRGPEMVLLVADDGRGFPFHGCFDAAQLAAMQAGPRTLRERAEELGGTLILTTTPQGATVEVRLPSEPEVVCV